MARRTLSKGFGMTTDCASVVIKRPADEVFEFMASADNMNLWSFGTWKTSIADDGLITGRAMQDGRTAYVRISASREQRLIDYYVGASPDQLSPRIFARVVAGEVADLGDDNCVLMMIALRSAGMDDERWRGLVNTHAVEVDLIRSLIESGHDHRV
jgi:hypothetical protein